MPGVIVTEELRLSLAGLRSFDFGAFTFGAGIEVAADRVGQRFHDARTPDRSSWGADLGPLLALDLPLAGPLYLRADGALLTCFLPRDAGVETPVTWRTGAAIGAFL